MKTYLVQIGANIVPNRRVYNFCTRKHTSYKSCIAKTAKGSSEQICSMGKPLPFLLSDTTRLLLYVCYDGPFTRTNDQHIPSMITQ